MRLVECGREETECDIDRKKVGISLGFFSELVTMRGEDLGSFLDFSPMCYRGGRFGLRRIASRLSLIGAVLGLVMAAASSVAQQPTNAPSAELARTEPTEGFHVPDGTEVKLRFAQPVIGPAALSLKQLLNGGVGLPPLARVGDSVKLVVAEDVRLGDKVIINKGAIAQARIEGVQFADPKSKVIETGLTLRLDWVTAITGELVPLRASHKGKSRPFPVDVFASHSGLTVREPNFRRDMTAAVTFKFLIDNFHRRTWVPAGTRITGFVQGEPALDAAKLAEVQTQLPAPNPKAIVTIYRTAGDTDVRLPVTCNQTPAGELGANENIVVEVTPGKSICEAGSGARIEFKVEPNAEYYIEARQRKVSHNWELKLVDPMEGEDAIAVSTFRPKQK
jgi:hypothetical protein